MNEIIEIKHTDQDKPTVNGRLLYERLEINSNYTTWMKRMIAYGFEEGKDYKTCLPNLESKIHGAHHMQDHELTIDMAKQICMIQRTPQGKACREYLIAIEDAWNKPEAVMARALMMANETLEGLKLENQKLLADNTQLTVANETMAPKAEYTDKVLDSKGLVKVSIMAKDFGVTPQWLNKFLHEKGIQFKQGQHWLLYQKYAELNYAHTKTYAVTDKKGEVHTRQHTLWTEEGRYFIYNLLKEEGYLPDTECSEGSNVLMLENKSEEQQEEVKEIKKNISKTPVKRMDTGEVYSSIKEAANAVGRTDAALHAAIKRGGKCAGTHWVKVEA